MFRSRFLLSLVLVGVVVGGAYGAARKIRSFTTYNESEDADGMAILNVHESTGQELQLMVTGFTPHTDYVVSVCLEDGSNDQQQGILSTNEVGNGTLHSDIGSPLLWPCVRIYLCTGEYCELRAQGCVGS